MNTTAAGTDDIVVTVDDIERTGCFNMGKDARLYYNCGADQEETLKENTRAYSRLRLRPRVLRDVAQRQLEVTLLGDQMMSMPIGISPTALQKWAHTDGEAATARASQAEGTVMILSVYSSTCIEDVKKAAPEGLRWSQLQIFKDRDLVRNLVRRAEGAGYRALVLTVDMPVGGNKIPRAKKSYTAPEGLRFANFKGILESGYTVPNSPLFKKRGLTDPSQTWDDVSWLMSFTRLPVVLKGITTAEDAEEAVKRGVSAIIVSNHGGRQLDGVPATIEILPEIVSAVGGRIEIYVDGGVRRGTDVIKALALGAKAVFVGRPTLWALAYNGEAGVRKMLAILREEVDRALALMGCSSVDQLCPEMVVHHGDLTRQARFDVGWK
ncbi:hydroxyacid oxidase 1 [Ixodes scapularis]